MMNDPFCGVLVHNRNHRRYSKTFAKQEQTRRAAASGFNRAAFASDTIMTRTGFTALANKTMTGAAKRDANALQ